jgi:malonate transporter
LNKGINEAQFRAALDHSVAPNPELVLSRFGGWHTPRMSTALLLLPDFMLIVLGFCLCRYTQLDRSVWDAVERLVYYVLFPVLLFNSIVKSPLAPGQTAGLAIASLSILSCGVGLALALGYWPGVNARLHASGAQTAYRFNSYIGLALAERLAGAQGLAWMALCIALCVPLANVAAVWPLARHGGHSYGRELIRNPLIVSTVAGLLANAASLHFPDAISITLQRIGVAALPLGLMATGAGLRLGSLRIAPALAAALMAIRHAALPGIAIGLVAALALPSDQRVIVVLFAALPTSSSTYVLAARMGGDGGYVAGLVTLSTLLGMLSVPLWLVALGALG